MRNRKHLMNSSNNPTLQSLRTSIRFESEEDSLGTGSHQQEKSQELQQFEQNRLSDLEETGLKLLSQISDSVFNVKYGRDFSVPSGIHTYMFTQHPRQYTYAFEAFASVVSIAKNTLKWKKEEMVFHSLFEDIIERYTNSRLKPNPTLIKTRSSEFCYRLAIIVEAVPAEVQVSLSFNMSSLRLYREYEIMHYIWEKFRGEFLAKLCTPDQLVGIPMPFEFVSVRNPEYDFESVNTSVHFFDIRGNYMPVKAARISNSGTMLQSFLNYMSMEKLGPSLSYMMDLLKSQRRGCSVSTALKILDQILCRLMVLHKYGIILGNLDIKFLNFGVREAVNVLYVNNFDCALVAPTHSKPIVYNNKRYASVGVLNGRSHFVNDIESAFYVFLSLLVPRLPWNDKEQTTENRRDSCWSIHERSRNVKSHIDEKKQLWNSPGNLDRLLRISSINTEFSSPAQTEFAHDIIQMVFGKTKDAISTCACIPLTEYMSATLIMSTPPHNAYNNIRKAIMAYFRFESLSNSLIDPICTNKIEHLVESENEDNRAFWDLNDWCWNIFETSFMSSGKKKTNKDYLTY